LGTTAAMSIFDKGKQLLGEAEKEARAHPQETEKLLGEAEQVVEKDTGGKYDKQIQEAGTKFEQQVVGTPPPAS